MNREEILARVENILDGLCREYDPAIDGDLDYIESIYWFSRKTQLYWWHDEAEQLHFPCRTLEEAKNEVHGYCNWLNLPKKKI